MFDEKLVEKVDKIDKHTQLDMCGRCVRCDPAGEATNECLLYDDRNVDDVLCDVAPDGVLPLVVGVVEGESVQTCILICDDFKLHTIYSLRLIEWKSD